MSKDYAELALKLKPYILPWLGRAGASGGASAGGGGLTAHALSGPFHSGQLSQSQATWAATATNLNAHAIDPDAHHDRQHSLDSAADHTGTLAWVKVNKTGSSLADLATRNYTQLNNRTHDILTEHSYIGGANLDLFGLSAGSTLARLTPSADVSAELSGGSILRSAAGMLTVNVLAAAGTGGKLRTPLIDTASGDLTLAPATGVTSLMELHAASRVRTPLINTASGDLTLSPVGDVILSPGSGAWVELTDGKALRTVSFASGFAGNGLRLDHGVGEAGKTSLEVDNVWVRGRMHVYELLIHQIRATNGSFFVSNTGKITTRTLYSGTEGAVNSQYTLNTDPEHGFVVGDLIRAQRWTGTGTYQSNLEVTLVGSATNLRAKLVSGDAPQVGYEYVRLGSTSSTDRKGGLFLTADDSGAPFLDIFDGVSSFATWGTPGVIKTRLGKLDGLGLSGGFSNEYGLFAGNGSTDADAYLRLSNSTNRLNNLSLEWWAGGSKLISITPGGGVDIRGAALESSVRAYTFSSPSTTFAGLYATQTATANWLGLRLIGNLGDTASDLLFSVTNSNNETSTTLTLEAVDWTETARIKLTAESVGTDGSLIELTADALAFTGAATFSSTLGVSGAVTLSNALSVSGKTTIQLGSLGSPSLAFTGDTDTGIYSPGADQITIAVGAQPRVEVSAGGVDVTGILTVTSNIYGGGEVRAASIFRSTSDSEMQLARYSVTVLRDFKGGDSYLALGAGRGASDVGHTYAQFTSNQSDQTSYGYGFRVWRYNEATPRTLLAHRGTGDFQLLTYEAADIALLTSSTRRLTVQSDGLVAVGPHTATSKLDVDGNTRAAGFYADAENGGIAGTVGISGGSNTAANGTGVGTIYMKGATNRSSGAFIKVYIGTAIWYIPAFATITG